MQVDDQTFPVFTLMARLTGRSHQVCHTLFENFEKAKSGDLEAQYDLAYGLHLIVPHLSESQIAGFTDEVKGQTMTACLKLFQDVAQNVQTPRQEQAKFMVGLLRSEGVKEPEVH